jgi:hypothetical protein
MNLKTYFVYGNDSDSYFAWNILDLFKAGLKRKDFENKNNVVINISWDVLNHVINYLFLNIAPKDVATAQNILNEFTKSNIKYENLPVKWKEFICVCNNVVVDGEFESAFSVF